jgi:5-(carboxyamino)imidazole ribonucleotide synthase
MNFRLGIIGGGQLALYLCEAAQRLGVEVAVFSATADAPALQAADTAILGDADNAADIERFLGHCDVVTFDMEAVANETLNQLYLADAEGRIAVRPGPDTLFMLKDKALQKAWLQAQGLPTLPFSVYPGAAASAESFMAGLEVPLVQKARCGGYDGRGVQILATRQDLEKLWDTPSIIEPCLQGCREISVITARGLSGELHSYPPVSMDFDPGLNSVRTVSMPAEIPADLAARAVRIAEQAVDKLRGVGVFAIEMFITGDGELLINEISPRVHNSGHLTLDACNVSQFEQHVRAVLGMPLLAVRQHSAAAMLNILYEESLREHCPATPVAKKHAARRTTLYWYGKAPGKPGRKMGHINALAPTADEAVLLANQTLNKLSAQREGYAA